MSKLIVKRHPKKLNKYAQQLSQLALEGIYCIQQMIHATDLEEEKAFLLSKGKHLIEMSKELHLIYKIDVKKLSLKKYT